MSISTELFGAHGSFQTYDPYSVVVARTQVFHLQCRNCGFEPEAVVTPPRFCPKCHCETWERFARPGSLLENAERH